MDLGCSITAPYGDQHSIRDDFDGLKGVISGSDVASPQNYTYAKRLSNKDKLIHSGIYKRWTFPELQSGTQALKMEEEMRESSFFISRSLTSDVLFHHAEVSKNVLLKTEYLSITRKAIDHSFMGKSGDIRLAIDHFELRRADDHVT